MELWAALKPPTVFSNFSSWSEDRAELLRGAVAPGRWHIAGPARSPRTDRPEAPSGTGCSPPVGVTPAEPKWQAPRCVRGWLSLPRFQRVARSDCRIPLWATTYCTLCLAFLPVAWESTQQPWKESIRISDCLQRRVGLAWGLLQAVPPLPPLPSFISFVSLYDHGTPQHLHFDFSHRGPIPRPLLSCPSASFWFCGF